MRAKLVNENYKACASDLKPGDIVMPFIDERKGKFTSRKWKIIDGPFDCKGSFKDIYITFKTKGPTPEDNEFIIQPDATVVIVK